MGRNPELNAFFCFYAFRHLTCIIMKFHATIKRKKRQDYRKRLLLFEGMILK